MRLRPLALAALGALALSGCAPSEPPAQPPPSEDLSRETSPIDGAAAPAQSPPAPAPPAYVADPEGFGSTCESDAGCGWDDGCAPSLCVGAAFAAPEPADCDETAPAPGDCLCHRGHCTLRPTSAPPPSEPGCKVERCGLDQAAARCVVGEMTQATRLPRDTGPACVCDDASDRCEFRWIDAVPCESERDCWVSDDVPWHPVARPKRLRGRRFRPCRDGELAPACRQGRCTLDAYSC